MKTREELLISYTNFECGVDSDDAAEDLLKAIEEHNHMRLLLEDLVEGCSRYSYLMERECMGHYLSEHVIPKVKELLK